MQPNERNGEFENGEGVVQREPKRRSFVCLLACELATQQIEDPLLLAASESKTQKPVLVS